MRGTILAAAVAAGIGLLVTAPASAAPATGAGGLLSAAEVQDAVIQAQWHGAGRSHWRWGSRGYVHGPNRSHWRWGSRGYVHGPNRSHWRWGSRGRW